MGGIVLVVPIVVITVLVEAILLVIVFGVVILFLPASETQLLCIKFYFYV